MNSRAKAPLLSVAEPSAILVRHWSQMDGHVDGVQPSEMQRGSIGPK